MTHARPAQPRAGVQATGDPVQGKLSRQMTFGTKSEAMRSAMGVGVVSLQLRPSENTDPDPWAAWISDLVESWR
jgi:hypothetical protein